MRLNYNYFKWPIKIRTCIAGALWICIGAIAFFCSETGHQFTNWTKGCIDIAYQKTDRYLSQIDIEWQTENHYTQTEEISKTIQVKQGDPMATIDLNKIKEQIEQLPWVRTAIVERYWPNIIKIKIEEKIPLALWQHNRKYHPLDDQGQIINTTKQLPADLLLVVGADAPKHLIPLLKELEQVPEINQYVRSAVRISNRRWNLKLFHAEKGLEVLLPETDILQALQRLERQNKKDKLIKRQIATIDLRNVDKVIIKPVKEQKPKQQKAKKK